MSYRTPLDSFECQACGAWMHMPAPPYDEGPKFCAYCGEESLEYRMHNAWVLEEVDEPAIEWLKRLDV